MTASASKQSRANQVQGKEKIGVIGYSSTWSIHVVMSAEITGLYDSGTMNETVIL